MGENAANMRGTILIPGMSHPVRHLVVVSQTLRQNGIDGSTYLLNYSPQVAWALFVIRFDSSGVAVFAVRPNVMVFCAQR
jgi:hypothetical protein